MKKDVVVGIVGTVILVAAMVGVFKYEASRGGGQSWRVTWADAEVPGPDAQGTTQVGGTTVAELNVSTANVTRITFTLKWTDDVGAPDAFNLTIAGPDGTMWSNEGDTGEVSVTVEGLAPSPAEIRLLAASQQEAEARVARDATTHAADGVWGATVKLVRAPGLVAPAGGVEVQPDGKNAWTLTATLTTYQPTFERG